MVLLALVMLQLCHARRIAGSGSVTNLSRKCVAGSGSVTNVAGEMFAVWPPPPPIRTELHLK